MDQLADYEARVKSLEQQKSIASGGVCICCYIYSIVGSDAYI